MKFERTGEYRDPRPGEWVEGRRGAPILGEKDQDLGGRERWILQTLEEPKPEKVKIDPDIWAEDVNGRGFGLKTTVCPRGIWFNLDAISSLRAFLARHFPEPK